MNKIVHAQYYANEVCNVVQLLAAFVASFIADVISFIAAAIVACCMFYCSCNRGLTVKLIVMLTRTENMPAASI